ncbi:unnamed protein product [Rotaria sp. Silwood1]|nr:unnamed protein product [Rotaria sp. Silwood1]CAF1644219.1 unnamed protein product [Rotaria sp. Silwood1]CAF3849503.1 unnamed protein product [Rotaria sp. Silwood1]CAF3893960.1 unnamed protein product [Rotaria sp. Silwood1]CAF4950484.1 unnamed protein product [Rotaria sp. Silwood1]
MSTTVYSNSHHDDDEINDNMSDEEEWSRETIRITNQCVSIPSNGNYYQPYDFHRRLVCYGDGGSLYLEYPVWIRGCLSEDSNYLGNNPREELLEGFYALNNKQEDFHKYPSPVEDIIDPDLLVCKPIKPPLPPSLPIRDYNDDEYDFEEKHKLEYELCNRWNYDTLTLRGSYQWIPSEFRICHGDNDDCEVHIETPISHLPMTEEYAKTYKNLEKIFAKFVPMFGEILHFDKKKGDTRLQVILKVQSYNIQPRMKYSGRWHTEGRTENIQAVGVYYLFIDDELEGGALKFRPSVAPSESYADIWRIEVNRYVMPETDTAIVFDNSLPHRFCSIRNTTSIARRRTFLNFFVVCPHNPIKEISISNLPLISYERCLTLLKSIEDENNQQKLPDLVIEKILSFLKQNMWKTDINAKEFRSRVRHEMLNEKTGWSGVQYGNTGDIVFIKSNNDWNIKKNHRLYRDMNGLEHTESD